MNIFVPKETLKKERRVALTPTAANKLIQLGAQLSIEAGLAKSINISDTAYKELGATVVKDREKAWAEADVVLRLNKPELAEVTRLNKDCIHISLLDPFFNLDLVEALAKSSVSALCMELIPRTSYAQKMDVLSSQASLAGYEAVIVAAERIGKALPMMTTPAGTIKPARVFVIGVGVAGLQAIATAKRLGARVEAYDTRPVVEEQVQSLGAKFVKIDVGETGQTEQGYAKALSEEQLEMQRQQMAKFCASADIVITTAQLFGRKAPVIVTADMVKGMRPGSVIVDMAAATGGNVEGSQPDKEVTKNGVKIIGLSNLSAKVAQDASQMYANNISNLLMHIWDEEEKRVVLNLEDDIVNSALLTHQGDVRDERIKALIEKGVAA